MDRRQQKTRKAIFQAFGTLLEQKKYNHITVQEIIDKADIGRSTFYAHFETKDDLLKELCNELFEHIVSRAMDGSHTHGLYTNNVPESVFCHLLQHLAENDNNILGLLSGESSEIFLRCFKDSLNELIYTQFVCEKRSQASKKLPDDFLVNHISGSFVEMVLWWIKGGMRQSPQQLNMYFRAVIEPVL